MFTNNKFSGFGEVNREDLKKVAKNALIFAAPAILIFLTAIQSGKSIQEASMALQVWGLNTVVDLLRKFMADNK